MKNRKRPKISFPAETGFIKMQPSLAAEIGRDPAIVLQYFIFLLEGDVKYLLWNENENSFWVRKSWNAITRDLYPYFMTDYIAVSTKETKDTNIKVSVETVKTRLRRIVYYLCRLELLISRQFRKETTGESSTVSWYSLNYPMLAILNGISVKWDYDADLGRLNVFSPERVQKQIASQPSLLIEVQPEQAQGMSPGHSFQGMSGIDPLTYPEKYVSTRHSSVSRNDIEYRSTIEKSTNIEKQGETQDSESLKKGWEEIFAGI